MIASPLEDEHVARIAAAGGDRVQVLFHPELLPVPRYDGDHHGVLARPHALRASPAGSRLSPRQTSCSTSTGSSPRPWASGVTLTLAAGDECRHRRVPRAHRSRPQRHPLHDRCGRARDGARGVRSAWPSLLDEGRAVPPTAAAERHWERYTAESLAGRRALVIGLGEVGREVARLLAALQMDVWGMRRTVEGALPPGVTRLVVRGSSVTRSRTSTRSCSHVRSRRRHTG